MDGGAGQEPTEKCARGEDEKPKMLIIEISCAEVWKEISNYLDGELSTELRLRMETHFKRCAHCKAVLDGARDVVKLVGDNRIFQLPEGFSKRLCKRLRDR
jgi:putative zinc finger protein